ncbi:MAG: OmpA family protein [Candidatus Delongbacteria bacterium]|jgi:outer membrane protein OmpA-like peptidoglycan-associated protein/tetratricopeptide (TPR) repeat protein|nr:OmpA family protein [Candidatus Delongbacteria bacterium]
MKNVINSCIVCLGIVMMSATYSLAQFDLVIDKGDFKHRKNGFRDAWNAVKDADDFYENKSRGSLRRALPLYEKAERYNSDYPPLNYKLGVCYMADKKIEKAIKILDKAYEMDKDVARDILYLLGKAYHYHYEFDKAIDLTSKFINTYEETGDSSYDKIIIDKAQRRIEQCNNAKKFYNNPIRVFVDNIGPTVNTKYPEYGPVITADESMIIFTSRREGTAGGERDPKDFQFYEDLYMAVKDAQGRWTNATNMRDLNTDGHDASIGLSYDGQILYTYNGTPTGTIMESNLEGDEWSNPEEMEKHINTKYHETSASVSPDGKYFYFVSDREKDDLGQKSYGGKDIYYCEKDDKGRWGDVKNIGKPINSEYNEEACFIHADGRTMYFSSVGHSSMGEYDIFYTEKGNDGDWSEPVNLGYPINTPDQDVFFVMAGSGRYGYYSTVRESGYGGQDIYRITFLGPEKLMVHGTEDKLMASLNSTISDKIVAEEVEVKTVRLTLLKGTVTDAISEQPIKAEIEIVDNEKNEVINVTHSNSSTGKYIVSLPSGKNYGISVKAEGYLFHSENFNIPAATGYQEVIKDIVLSKVGVGSSIVLKNIFFDYDKATLRPESYPELERLYKLLNNYGDMRIEIGGHTDNRGSLKYNTELSEERAKAVVDYLVNMGIDESRLEYKGYAYLKPIDTNDTEEGRQNNRRVEFKVLSVN